MTDNTYDVKLPDGIRIQVFTYVRSDKLGAGACLPMPGQCSGWKNGAFERLPERAIAMCNAEFGVDDFRLMTDAEIDAYHQARANAAFGAALMEASRGEEAN
jgi:hypothetical protein